MENKMEYSVANNEVVISFFGELDSNTVVKYRHQLSVLLENYQSDVIFDFSKTSFIDSAGIGLVLGRYQQLKLESRKLILTGLNQIEYRLFEISGMFEIMEYREVIKS